MDCDDNACQAVGDKQPHPEPVVLPDAQGSSTEPSRNRYMLDYYLARRHFRFGRFLAPMRFPVPDDYVWMRFIDDELVADGVYRNSRFGAILALELQATVGEGDETISSWEQSITMDGDDDPEPVVEFDRLLRMREVQFHHLSAPTRFPPEHDASYTLAMDDMLRLRESNFIFLGNGQPAPDPPDGGAAAYRNGGFGAVPASEEAMAALPETTVGVGEARGKECAVCLEVYEAGDTLRTMPCSHGFPECCIFQWLQVSRLCPICRFAMPAAAKETAESFSFMRVGDDDGYGGDGEEEPSAWIHQMHSS